MATTTYHDPSHGSRTQFESTINSLTRDLGDLVATFGDRGLCLGTDGPANALYEEASLHARRARTALGEFRSLAGVHVR